MKDRSNKKRQVKKRKKFVPYFSPDIEVKKTTSLTKKSSYGGHDTRWQVS